MNLRRSPKSRQRQGSEPEPAPYDAALERDDAAATAGAVRAASQFAGAGDGPRGASAGTAIALRAHLADRLSRGGAHTATRVAIAIRAAGSARLAAAQGRAAGARRLADTLV